MSAISKKIRKLLAVAEDAGATEAEAQTALEMAQALAAKHAIDMAQLLTPEEQEISRRMMKASSRQGDFWWSRVSVVVYALYPVQVWRQPWGKITEYHVAGSAEFLDAAVDTFSFITAQVERLYKENLPSGMTQRERANYRKSFKWACATRVMERAQELKRQLTTDNNVAQRHTGQNALVVRESRDELVSNVRDYLKNEGFRFTQARPKRGAHGIGSSDGARAGNDVQFHRGLST